MAERLEQFDTWDKNARIMDKINVLVSLNRGYGLGDCVQMSAVLRHLAKHRPHWVVDYQSEEGRHCVGRGIVANTFAYGTPYPTPHYDAEVHILLYDTWANWGDRPNTRVSSCLRERFDLEWDADCGRYQVMVSEQASKMVEAMVSPRGYRHEKRAEIAKRSVVLHYQGDSSASKKNLTHPQAEHICKEIEKLGYNPLLLDWRNVSPLPDSYHIHTVGRIPTARQWGNDAEINCAVISQCAAFVGIDSGPSKCASATDTPALVIWTGHHPAPFHDPAPNTTHLVPKGYHGLEPVCNDRGVIDWFERHYNVRYYNHDLVGEVGAWLREVLK